MQVARPDSQPTIKCMTDVDRMCFNALDGRGLRLKPLTLRSASGKDYVTLLMDIGAVVKMMYTDPATAQTLDPFGGRTEPPGAQADSSQRRFGSILTGDWALGAQDRLPSGAELLPLSCFWDDTVRTSTGAKYCGLQMYNNRLPLATRFHTDNIFVIGFAPILTAPTTDAAFAALSKARRATWLKRERDSIRNGVLQHVLESFTKCEAGILIDVPAVHQGCNTSLAVVPVLACWWVDHPQHMALVACKQCGFCDVGGRGKQGLADFDEPVELRHTEGVRDLVKQGDKAALDAAGVHGVELPQWKETYTDAYQNTSISPLHVLKGTYKDLLQWTLQVCT